MHKVERSSVSSVIACVVLGMVLACFLVVATARADDAGVLLKQFNKDFRKVQGNMFAGKNEQAIESLGQLQMLLDRIEVSDPNNPKLKAAKNKYKKLVKDIERRTGRDLGAGTATVSAGTMTELPPKPQTKAMPVTESSAPVLSSGDANTAVGQVKDLPYNARRPFKKAESSISRVGSYTGRLLDPGYTGSKDQLVANATKNIANAKGHLAEAQHEAAAKGVASHPEFDRLAAEIAAAEKQLDAAVVEYRQLLTTAAASADEVNKDVEVLRQAYNRSLPLFQKAIGTVPYYNDLKPLSDLIDEIEAFEINDQAALKQQLGDFAAKYGTTREQIDHKADAMGYSGEGRASYSYQELTQGIENIKKTRELTADDILRRAKEMQSNASKGRHDFSRIEGHATIKQWGRMAARFDMDNPRVRQFNDTLDEWIAKDSAALDAKIDRAVWPSQAGDSPDNANQLTQAANEFLQRHAKADTAKGKSPRTIVGVVITGPWRIFKRNILGEPIQYGLPVMVGEQWAVEKDMDRVRAYQMSMLTEEYKGVKTAPPFIGAAVGDSFYVRPGKIK